MRFTLSAVCPAASKGEDRPGSAQVTLHYEFEAEITELSAGAFAQRYIVPAVAALKERLQRDA